VDQDDDDDDVFFGSQGESSDDEEAEAAEEEVENVEEAEEGAEDEEGEVQEEEAGVAEEAEDAADGEEADDDGGDDDASPLKKLAVAAAARVAKTPPPRGGSGTVATTANKEIEKPTAKTWAPASASRRGRQILDSDSNSDDAGNKGGARGSGTKAGGGSGGGTAGGVLAPIPGSGLKGNREARELVIQAQRIKQRTIVVVAPGLDAAGVSTGSRGEVTLGRQLDSFIVDDLISPGSGLGSAPGSRSLRERRTPRAFWMNQAWGSLSTRASPTLIRRTKTAPLYDHLP
jgi:hypothetical protein